jgi:hypothetical protein
MTDLARFQRTVVDDTGAIIPSPTVEVRDQVSNALVSIFSDRAGASALSNPFTGTTEGLAAFHVAGGAYKVTATSGSFTAEWTWVGIGTASEFDFVDFEDYVDDEISPLLADVAAAKTIPQNAQTGAYTLLIGDVGKHVSITTGGVTVPSGVFTAGDVVSIYNDSGSSQTITQGSGVTLRLAGSATTGSRTLTQRGICTVLCVANNEFVISGAGLT